MALYGLLGTMISILTGKILGFSSDSIRYGLYGYNSCLTSLIISLYSSNENIVELIGSIVLMSICTTLIFHNLSQFLVIRLGISPLTFPSQISSFIWLFSLQKFSKFSLNESQLKSTFSSNVIDKSVHLSNITLGDTLAEYSCSISQIYQIDNPLSGVIILIGIFICSPILSFQSLFGAITGQLSAKYLFGCSEREISSGLWGYNSVLVCQAIGGMFYLLSGYRIWLLTLFGSIMTVIVQGSVCGLLKPYGFPPLLIPSMIVSWLFSQMNNSSERIISIELKMQSTPEEHLRKFRLKRLVNQQFEFLKNVSTILRKTDPNVDISIDYLTGMEAELIPILLCSFTHQNDLINLKTLLNKGANVNSTDYDLRTALHIASCDGNIEFCRLLIKKFRANVNAADDFGGTPLYDAFSHGNFHLIPFVYSQGGRMPQTKTKELIYYLCAFSFEGNLEAVQYLLACGVNPNLTDHYGRTPLHLAVCGNHLNIVKYLIEIANASVLIGDQYGHTPIDEATNLSDRTILAFFQYERNYLFKEKRKDPRIKVKKISEEEEEDEEEEMFDDDDSVEDNPKNVEDSLLPAIFCMAASEGNIRQMASILQQFPQFRIDSVDYDYRSAAHVAAAEGQLISVRFLYDYCYSKNFHLNWINREDRWGRTPIEEAFRREHYHVVSYLQERIQVRTQSIVSDGETNQLSNTEKFVISFNKWRKILHFATLVSNNKIELIRGFLISGAFSASDFYADYDGRTPMHIAAANGYLDIIKLLQLYGDNGKNNKDRWGNSALDEARRKKFDQIVAVLLDDIV